MKNILVCGSMAIWLALAHQAVAADGAQAPKAGQRVALFDGKNLDAWDVLKCEAVVDNGEILIKAGNGLVQSKKKYGNFIFEYEWKALKDKDWDSGIYFRYDSRTPDIGELKMSAFSSQRLADGVAHSQSRSWEKGWGRVQFLAEFGDHSRAMNRALCGQRDAQFLMGHLDVCPAG